MSNTIFSKFVKKIIHNILNVKPGQTVTIFAEIHNVSDPNEPLEEIPLLEELAIQLRKHNALPILDISTENLHKRCANEIYEDNHHILPELFNIWLKTSDYFIDLSWRSSPTFYKSIPEGSYKKVNDLSDFYIHQLENHNKKVILLGTPTKSLAKYFNIDYNVLTETYIAALDTDYFLMKQRCLIFNGQINKNKAWTITTENRTLTVDLIGESRCYFGEFCQEAIMSLPTGYWQQEINVNTLTGIFFCDYVFFEEKMWSNVQLIIEKGNIIDLETDRQQKNIPLLKYIFGFQIQNAILQYGLNTSIQKMSFYKPFDILKYQNISITITCQKGQIILLTEKGSLQEAYENNI